MHVKCRGWWKEIRKRGRNGGGGGFFFLKRWYKNALRKEWENMMDGIVYKCTLEKNIKNSYRAGWSAAEEVTEVQRTLCNNSGREWRHLFFRNLEKAFDSVFRNRVKVKQSKLDIHRRIVAFTNDLECWSKNGQRWGRWSFDFSNVKESSIKMNLDDKKIPIESKEEDGNNVVVEEKGN